MKQPRTLIFDFDGTLADTLGMAITELRKFMAGGKRPVDDAAIERLRSMSARQAFKTMGVRWWQLPYIAYLGRKKVSEQIDTIKTFDGMLKVLRSLHEDGLQMMIVSSNSNKNIHRFLQNNKMDAYFEKVYGDMGIFDKAGALRKIMKANNLTVEQCRYIGDEVRDVEAARKAGMHIVSVTWGYNNHKALEAAEPEIMVDKPHELLRLFAAKA